MVRTQFIDWKNIITAWWFWTFFLVFFSLPTILLCLFVYFKSRHTLSMIESANSNMPSVAFDPDSNDFKFAVRMMQQLYKADENLIYSPYSLVAVLMMLLIGAHGHCQMQLSKTLFDTSSDVSKLVGEFVSVDKAIRESNKKVMQVANFFVRNGPVRFGSASYLDSNSLFLTRSFNLSAEYLKQLSTDFNSTAKTVNFHNASIIALINGDVSKATAGMIPHLFNQLDPNTIFVLVNAIYFKGRWSLPFNEDETDKHGTFHLESGKKVEAPLMYQKEYFAYFEQSGVKAIKLDYNDSSLSMVAILPPKGLKLDIFIRKNLGGALDHVIANLANASEVLVRLTLPRFKLSTTKFLVHALKALGIEDIFGENANFSGITTNWKDLSVSDVVQKAVIEVNEKGTKAAAATGERDGMCYHCTEAPVPTFKANRPFLFVLLHIARREIFFFGVVQNPTSKGD